MLSLHRDCILEIIGRLPYESVLTLSCVSRLMDELCNDADLWVSFLSQRGYRPYPHPKLAYRRSLRAGNLNVVTRHTVGALPASIMERKDIIVIDGDHGFLVFVTIEGECLLGICTRPLALRIEMDVEDARVQATEHEATIALLQQHQVHVRRCTDTLQCVHSRVLVGTHILSFVGDDVLVISNGCCLLEDRVVVERSNVSFVTQNETHSICWASA
jgi:hypothetical protein